MANQYKNHIVYFGDTLIDLRSDTVTAETLLEGYTAHDASGAVITGTYVPTSSAITVITTPDSHGGEIKEIVAVDISRDTVTAATLLQGYTAHDRRGNAVTGTYVPSGGSVQANKTVSPTTSQQIVTPDAGYDALAQVTVNAVQAGSEGMPVATKGSVSGNSITVTPSVTNTEGYISGGTKTGTAVTVTASELVSGSQTITENDTYDVTNLSEVVVNVADSGEDTLLQALRNTVTSVSDDTLTSIRSYGLAYMTALTSASFPNLQTINSYAFYNDYAIIWDGWEFPKAKTVGNYAFRYCYGLTGDIVLPSTVTSIGQYSFASCTGMTTFTATGAIGTFGTYTFTGASGHVMALREIHLPNLGTGIALNLNFGSATAANACQHLEVCDIGKAKSIAANTFANCYKLQTLIMRRTSVTTCANVNAFFNTPLRGRNSLTAKIYVPQSLINSYKAASVWSTINGYGYVEWLPIEGSEWEL